MEGARLTTLRLTRHRIRPKDFRWYKARRSLEQLAASRLAECASSQSLSSFGGQREGGERGGD